MTRAARLFLLITAALCTAFIVMAGIGFASMAEPARDDAWSTVFWVLAGLLVASPLWIPALTPARHPLFFAIVRRVGALALLPPTLLFARMFVDQIAMGGLSVLLAPSSGYVASVVLLATCLTSIWLLAQPDLYRVFHRRAWRAAREAS